MSFIECLARRYAVRNQLRRVIQIQIRIHFEYNRTALPKGIIFLIKIIGDLQSRNEVKDIFIHPPRQV
ncbi:hypothetical protein ACHQM5_026353 [Ranunculus cassubicifolius]